MDLFIFGTLLHLPLLEVVSGDAAVAQKCTPATRDGHGVDRVAGQVFPMMSAQVDAVASGIILSGLDDEALMRLDFYEKAFGYDRVAFTVTDQTGAQRDVTAYMPEEGRWEPAKPWDFGGWAAAYGEVTTLTAREAMGLYGEFTPREMGVQYPQMMARAASRQRAMREAAKGDLGRDDVQVIEARKAYSGFFTVQEMDLAFRRFDGSMSEPVSRSVFVGVDCAIVLPYDPVRDRVMVVEQFRPGAYMRGDPNPWTVEPIAGRIDPGEGPEEAARREAREEAGVDVRALHTVSAAYPSPGTTTEHFFVYVGECDLPDVAAHIGGLEDEAEDIRSHVMEWDEFDQGLSSGRFNLLPLLVAGHWLARNRERLKAEAA
ncbi:NUDIX domain-containing protein [Pseudooctadecabacter jejudonensis]|uniref:ADP-ribose pyrophosphatase n=1 Tax=Pseudooctadecabacter jejudonensis TaxID=1391910 RepID=A0A1Y5RGG2_9RHOB|nr:NUDIX domain-containing protein [Pseudooctadecabacter jejudonensis]SLN14303.1 ADP-ribose pyrophosphatase [Pseudooctadecabacter jejudonensis]